MNLSDLLGGPPEGDYIQLPVDQAYARGIAAMGKRGPQAGGMDWLNAIAHGFGGGIVMRGGVGEPTNPILGMLARALGRSDKSSPVGLERIRQGGIPAAATLDELAALRPKFSTDAMPGPLKQPIEARGLSSAPPLKPDEASALYNLLFTQSNPRFRAP